VLFNPVLITAPVPGLSEAEVRKLENMQSRPGAEPNSMSPFHSVRSGLGPTIIFHGHDDKTVPYRHAELFTAAMTAAGNHCDLVGYLDQRHGFFNAHHMDNAAYRDTMRCMDAFLVELGWLDPL
jgi:dipeptidyl aminopeptidase/acylaminoacyl peptidase